MEINLEKEEKVDGKTWFNLSIDGHTVASYSEEDEMIARDMFRACVGRARSGYPKRTTVLSETITAALDQTGSL